MQVSSNEHNKHKDDHEGGDSSGSASVTWQEVQRSLPVYSKGVLRNWLEVAFPSRIAAGHHQKAE